MLKSDFSEAATRITYKHLLNQSKPLVEKMIINHIDGDKKFKQAVHNFLNTEIGESLLCVLISAACRTFKVKGFEQIQEAIGKEMSVMAMENAGTLLSAIISSPASSAFYNLLQQQSVHLLDKE